MSTSLNQFLSTVAHVQADVIGPDEEVVSVSKTVSVAVSVYETIRNTLEYDEEHRMRRNAIHRFLKRRFGDEDLKKMASDLVHELVWARYLPNKKVRSSVIEEVVIVLKKYDTLFEDLDEESRDYSKNFFWIIDLMATEIEYRVKPPRIDEALASFAYQDLRSRVEWSKKTVKEEDRDMQLFIAVHRAILKSDQITQRYRIFALYYPDWIKNPSDALVKEISNNLAVVISSVESQLHHKAADPLYRMVQKQAMVYHVLRDMAEEDPQQFISILGNEDLLEGKVKTAAKLRYDKFKTKLGRSIFRAVFFLFITKMTLGLAIELPYDIIVMKASHYLPLITNILFPPFLLAVIGLTVRIPEKKNTQHLLQHIRSVTGIEEPHTFRFQMNQSLRKGFGSIIFHTLYVLAFFVSISVIATGLRKFDFNIVSISFFLLFLSLVLFFGLKIRGTKRDLLVVDTSGGFFATLFDIFFLPIIRVGRWISMRAPKVNVFLFFLDFIIEAPFKSAIRITEGWLAFLKEKKEEI